MVYSKSKNRRIFKLINIFYVKGMNIFMEEKEENLNFETAMKQLEEIANQLERNDLDLDKAVEKFEEGMKLSKKCNEILENAEKKITILINDGKDNFSEEEFNTNKE
jgi:exodeoxyribonuclease VII, small subunit